MTIKIEITGESIEEVADKLLALGSKLSGASTIAVAAATTAAPSGDVEGKAKRTRKSAPAAEATASSQSDTAAADTGSAGASETPSSGTPSGESTTSDAAAIDFDKDVTPAVLGAVEAHGRDKVTEVLSQFGVARASQLDEARWPELLAALADIA